jgi:hypothetical protein
LPSSLDGPLDSSILTFDRLGDIDPAKLFDLMIQDAVQERGAPGVGESVEDGWHVRADGLAFGSGGGMGPAVFDDLAISRVKGSKIGI